MQAPFLVKKASPAAYKVGSFREIVLAKAFRMTDRNLRGARLNITRLSMLIVLASTSVLPQTPQPESPAALYGTIRAWGSAQMTELIALWEHGFHRQHPGVGFEDKLNGTVSGMGGLYGGGADLSLMGREIWPTEAMAYEQMAGHPATGVQVALGSFDVPTKADALVIFVHRDNPIASLTFAHLRAIFGCGSKGCNATQTWGELGVRGVLADRPIHAYGYKLDNAAAIFFKSVVLKNVEWRCGIKAFANQLNPDGKRVDSGQLILDALRNDPFGIAISNSHYANPDVKAVALASTRRSPPIAPTKEAVASGSYPLSRAVYIFFNQPPAAPVREFLSYVLSREGQEDVSREGAYLPLPEKARQEQLKMIH